MPPPGPALLDMASKVMRPAGRGCTHAKAWGWAALFWTGALSCQACDASFWMAHRAFKHV